MIPGYRPRPYNKKPRMARLTGRRYSPSEEASFAYPKRSFKETCHVQEVPYRHRRGRRAVHLCRRPGGHRLRSRRHQGRYLRPHQLHDHLWRESGLSPGADKTSGSEFQNNGSRFGFRASHELNSDLSAFARMEFRFDADERNNDGIKDIRNSYLGLKSQQLGTLTIGNFDRSEERRVGKECRAAWSAYQL